MITCNTAYRAAKRRTARRMIDDRTDAAPKIYRLRKDGTRGAIVKQDHHRWTDREGAQRVADKLMAMNPGTLWEVE